MNLVPHHIDTTITTLFPKNRYTSISIPGEKQPDGSDRYVTDSGNHKTIECSTDGEHLTPADGNLVPAPTHDNQIEGRPAHCAANVCTTHAGIQHALWDTALETFFPDGDDRAQRCRVIYPTRRCHFTCNTGYHEVPTREPFGLPSVPLTTQTIDCPSQNYTWPLTQANQWQVATVVNRCDGNVCSFSWIKLVVTYSYRSALGSCEFEPWRVGRENEYMRDTPPQIWYNRKRCSGDVNALQDKMGVQMYAGNLGFQYNMFQQNPIGPAQPPKENYGSTPSIDTYLKEPGHKQEIDLILTNPTRDGWFLDGATAPKGVSEKFSAAFESVVVSGNVFFHAREYSNRIIDMEGYAWSTVPAADCQDVTHPARCSAYCLAGYTQLGGPSATSVCHFHEGRITLGGEGLDPPIFLCKMNVCIAEASVLLEMGTTYPLSSGGSAPLRATWKVNLGLTFDPPGEPTSGAPLSRIQRCIATVPGVRCMIEPFYGFYFSGGSTLQHERLAKGTQNNINLL